MKRADIRLALPPWWDELTDVSSNTQPHPQTHPHNSSSLISAPGPNLQLAIPAGSSIVKGTVGQNTSDHRSSIGNVMSILVNKPSNSDGNNGSDASLIYNNRPSSGRTYIRYDSGLHLHQGMSNLHPSEEYYRTQATSPFQTNIQSGEGAGGSSGTPQNELVVPGMNMNLVTASPSEDPRRHSSNRTYEDYGSDDELGREDINFPMDGGKNFSFSFLLNCLV